MSATITQAVRITDRLHECRDAARTLLGDSYVPTMAEYQKVIKAVAEKANVELLDAALQICKGVTDPRFPIFVMAATVELVEPSA